MNDWLASIIVRMGFLALDFAQYLKKGLPSKPTAQPQADQPEKLNSEIKPKTVSLQDETSLSVIEIE